MKKLTIEEELNVIALKNKKTPIKNIMEKYDIKSSKTIYDILERNGREHLVANKKYNVDDKYFEYINNEEKAYWLGFLYADGYVRLKEGRSGELRLKLKKDDRKHIELFAKSINSTHPIKNMTSKVIVDNVEYISECSTFSVYNTKMVNDLIRHGCINNKTFKIKFPELKNDLIRHFMRGYFDGDGCVNLYNKNKLRISITSGSYNFIKSYMNILKKLNWKQQKLTQQDNAFTIHSGNKHDIGVIFNFFYKNSSIYLNRKFLKFKNNL